MELIGKKVLVRAHSAGVYYGTLKAVEGRTVTLTTARNIWRWSGANTIMELSVKGAKNRSNCRFSIYVEEVVILDACQIIPCTGEAVKNIESVEPWEY